MVRFSNKSRGARITGAIFMLVCALLLFFPFIGNNFIWGSGSPLMVLVGMFGLMMFGNAGMIIIGILYILLFLACLILPILTGIMALINNRYFSRLWATITYGVMTLLFLVFGIILAVSGSAVDMAVMQSTGNMFGVGAITFMPTLWLVLAIGMDVAAAILLKKEKVIVEPPMPPTPVDPPEPPFGGSTIPVRPKVDSIRLQISYGDESGSHIVKRDFPVNGAMTIGRNSGCTLALVDGTVSDNHAEISYSSMDGLVIADMGSSNGVWVNGKSIVKRAKINEESTVRLGNTNLRFKMLGIMTDSDDGEKTIVSKQRAVDPLNVMLTYKDEYGDQDRRFTLENKPVWIGSLEQNEVWVNNTTVSKKHARLVNEGKGKVKIVDNNSTNGVRVNDDHVTEAYLQSGDVITLGDVTMKIYIK